MKPEYLVPIIIGAVQIGVIFVQFDLKSAFKRMINAFNHSAAQDESTLTMRIIKIVGQFRRLDETKEAQDISAGVTSAEAVKQVTDALEAITLSKDKDVKIIISNDRTSQECFIVKLSYRPDDQV